MTPMKYKGEESGSTETGPRSQENGSFDCGSRSRQSGGFVRGRGGYERGRGGFVRERSGYERGWGGFVRGRGGYERVGGGFVRGRGGYERGRGGFVRGRSGYERGWGGFVRGRGGYKRGPGGFVGGRGGYERGRGGFVGGRGGFRRDHGGFNEETAKIPGSHEDLMRRIEKSELRYRQCLKRVPSLYRNLPIFRLDDKLKAFPLKEFDGWLFEELFGMLSGMSRSIRQSGALLWEDVLIRPVGGHKNKTDAKRSVWKKLIQSLPLPTLKDSLSSCRRLIGCNLKLEEIGNHNPEWPKLRFSGEREFLSNEVTSALGECKLPGVVLFVALLGCAKNVVTSKYRDERTKFYLSAADFFKKYPDSFPWEDAICDAPDIEEIY